MGADVVVKAAIPVVVLVVKAARAPEVVEGGSISLIPDVRLTMDGSLGMYLSILTADDIMHKNEANKIGRRTCLEVLKLIPMVNSLETTATINQAVCF